MPPALRWRGSPLAPPLHLGLVIVVKVVILVSENFEDAEFRVPADRILASGRELVIVGARANETLHGCRGEETIVTHLAIGALQPEQCIGVLVPGGPSALALASQQHVLDFVKWFHFTGRPLAAIGHGVALLLSAHVGKGCQLTSDPSLRTELKNLGATWRDEHVVVDGHLVTAQALADTNEFTESFIHCVSAAEMVTSPREWPPEHPPLG